MPHWLQKVNSLAYNAAQKDILLNIFNFIMKLLDFFLIFSEEILLRRDKLNNG